MNNGINHTTPSIYDYFASQLELGHWTMECLDGLEERVERRPEHHDTAPRTFSVGASRIFNKSTLGQYSQTLVHMKASLGTNIFIVGRSCGYPRIGL